LVGRGRTCATGRPSPAIASPLRRYFPMYSHNTVDANFKRQIKAMLFITVLAGAEVRRVQHQNARPTSGGSTYSVSSSSSDSGVPHFDREAVMRGTDLQDKQASFTEAIKAIQATIANQHAQPKRVEDFARQRGPLALTRRVVEKVEDAKEAIEGKSKTKTPTGQVGLRATVRSAAGQTKGSLDTLIDRLLDKRHGLSSHRLPLGASLDRTTLGKHSSQLALPSSSLGGANHALSALDQGLWAGLGVSARPLAALRSQDPDGQTLYPMRLP